MHAAQNELFLILRRLGDGKARIAPVKKEDDGQKRYAAHKRAHRVECERAYFISGMLGDERHAPDEGGQYKEKVALQAFFVVHALRIPF